MWPFKRSPKNKPLPEAATSSLPVENPGLEAAMLRHRLNPSEATVSDVGHALSAARYLIPVKTDAVISSPKGNGIVTFEPGSILKFMVCQNTAGESFVPAFTSWHELRMWAGNDANAFVMSSRDLWGLALRDSARYAGVVINPATNPWTLSPQNIRTLLEEIPERPGVG